MASVVLGDIANFCLSVNNKKLYEVKDALEHLFTLYIVCYIYMRREG